jgi:hypothetical protein
MQYGSILCLIVSYTEYELQLNSKLKLLEGNRTKNYTNGIYVYIMYYKIVLIL